MYNPAPGQGNFLANIGALARQNPFKVPTGPPQQTIQYPQTPIQRSDLPELESTKMFNLGFNPDYTPKGPFPGFPGGLVQPEPLTGGNGEPVIDPNTNQPMLGFKGWWGQTMGPILQPHGTPPGGGPGGPPGGGQNPLAGMTLDELIALLQQLMSAPPDISAPSPGVDGGEP